jgi:hypothetical protein
MSKTPTSTTPIGSNVNKTPTSPHMHKTLSATNLFNDNAFNTLLLSTQQQADLFDPFDPFKVQHTTQNDPFALSSVQSTSGFDDPFANEFDPFGANIVCSIIISIRFDL